MIDRCREVRRNFKLDLTLNQSRTSKSNTTNFIISKKFIIKITFVIYKIFYLVADLDGLFLNKSRSQFRND